MNSNRETPPRVTDEQIRRVLEEEGFAGAMRIWPLQLRTLEARHDCTVAQVIAMYGPCFEAEPARQRATWVKQIARDRHGDVVAIEPTHRMRVDGVGRLKSVKVPGGPVAGFVDALARGLCIALQARPQTLDAGDLSRPEVSLGMVDFRLRMLAGKYPNDAVREEVSARMLSLLSPGFVASASRLIQAEAAKHGAEVYV